MCVPPTPSRVEAKDQPHPVVTKPCSQIRHHRQDGVGLEAEKGNYN
jgi:hypothetical protein